MRRAGAARPWHAAAFHVCAAVKACAVLGVRLPWTGALLDALAFVQPDTRLRHPYPQLVGWTLLCVQAAPGRLREALACTATHADTDPLLQWISRSFLSPQRPAPPVGAAAAWWDELEEGPRQGPVWWVPFNFA